jgi:hypothetical protein
LCVRFHCLFQSTLKNKVKVYEAACGCARKIVIGELRALARHNFALSNVRSGANLQALRLLFLSRRCVFCEVKDALRAMTDASA